MQLISSRLTFFVKRVFPLLWFGFLAFIVATAVAERVGRKASWEFVLLPVVIPFCLAFLVYALMRRTTFGLVDEVWDAGSELVVRNKGSEDRVPLSAIINVGYSLPLHAHRVTLTLREDGLFGREISFVPRRQFEPFSRNPIVDDLIQRVDAARRSA